MLLEHFTRERFTSSVAVKGIYLRDDELARRIMSRHVVGVDVVRAFLVVDGLQLVARVVVG